MKDKAKAQLRMEAERLRTENRNLKQQVSDMRAQINVGEKPLRQRIEQLETRCKKLKTEAESLPQLMESIKKADALSAAVLAEFDYVRDKHPETKDGFSCAYFQAMERARNAYEESKGK